MSNMLVVSKVVFPNVMFRLLHKLSTIMLNWVSYGLEALFNIPHTLYKFSSPGEKLQGP